MSLRPVQPGLVHTADEGLGPARRARRRRHARSGPVSHPAISTRCTRSTTSPAPGGNSNRGSTVHLVGGPATRQAGVFYPVSSGSGMPHGQVLTSAFVADRVVQRL